MDDLISRQAVLDVLRTCYDTERKDFTDGSEWINYEDAVAMIEELPSAQPEIIHCKDCINCSRDAIYDDYWCNGMEVTADHYCGYAERREDG